MLPLDDTWFVFQTISRAKYFDAEHKGVKVLMLIATQPGSVHMVKKPIRSLEDFKGLRLCFATTSIRDFIENPVKPRPLGLGGRGRLRSKRLCWL